MRWWIFVLLFVAGCEGPGVGTSPGSAHGRSDCRTTIEYFEDPRTSLCFAYCWGGGGALDSAYGGPGLTLVPQEACDLWKKVDK